MQQKFRTVSYRVSPSDTYKRPNRPFSAAVLSDLHNVTYGHENAQLLQAIEQISPEFIVCCGDLVTAKGGRYGIDHAANLVRELAKRYPVFLSQGNHELRLRNRSVYGDANENYIQRAGIKPVSDLHVAADASGEMPKAGAYLLDDAGVRLTVHDMPIRLTGYSGQLSDYHRGFGSCITREQVQKALGNGFPEEFVILAAHHPDGFPAYADWGADLVLSGHVHGGIVRIPYLGGVIGASLIPFPPYTRGVYRQGDAVMIVSAGLGSHTIKLRVNNPTELIHLKFT